MPEKDAVERTEKPLGEPRVGLGNNGTIVVKNRAYRRRWRTTAELEGKSKNYYTKKKTHKRKRNGKTITVRKKTRK